MIEDILTEFATGGFLVSNTFQTGEDNLRAFGPSGWKVYIRNVRNTRTGMGQAETLEGALRAAFGRAMEGPTYEQAQRATPPQLPPRVPPRVPILGSDTSTETSDELF